MRKRLSMKKTHLLRTLQHFCREYNINAIKNNYTLPFGNWFFLANCSTVCKQSSSYCSWLSAYFLKNKRNFLLISSLTSFSIALPPWAKKYENDFQNEIRKRVCRNYHSTCQHLPPNFWYRISHKASVKAITSVELKCGFSTFACWR